MNWLSLRGKPGQEMPEIGSDVILLLCAFGRHKNDGQLCSSNRAMGILADDLAIKYSVKAILVQGEASLVMTSSIDLQIEEERKNGTWVTTWDIIEQVKKYLKERNLSWENVIIIAHPWHYPRIHLTCKKQGVEKFIIPQRIYRVKFPGRNSKDWFTWNRFLWILPDLFRRFQYLLKK